MLLHRRTYSGWVAADVGWLGRASPEWGDVPMSGTGAGITPSRRLVPGP